MINVRERGSSNRSYPKDILIPIRYAIILSVLNLTKPFDLVINVRDTLYAVKNKHNLIMTE